jgi:hypothetical protein
MISVIKTSGDDWYDCKFTSCDKSWITIVENTDEIVKMLEDNNVPDGVIKEYFKFPKFCL